jgi:hypothetical protein
MSLSLPRRRRQNSFQLLKYCHKVIIRTEYLTSAPGFQIVGSAIGPGGGGKFYKEHTYFERNMTAR